MGLLGYYIKYKGQLTFKQELDKDQLDKAEVILTELDTDFEITGAGNGIQWDYSDNTYTTVESLNKFLDIMKKEYPDFLGVEGILLAQGNDVGNLWYIKVNEEGRLYAEEIKFEI